MLKKNITYTDYDGATVTEENYFNLTNGELMEMDLETAGQMKAILEKIVKNEDIRGMGEFYKKLILKSYGKKVDGKFLKSEAYTNEFAPSEAYSELFIELMTVDGAAVNFVKGILPKQGPSSVAPATNA